MCLMFRTWRYYVLSKIFYPVISQILHLCSVSLSVVSANTCLCPCPYPTPHLTFGCTNMGCNFKWISPNFFFNKVKFLIHTSIQCTNMRAFRFSHFSGRVESIYNISKIYLSRHTFSLGLLPNVENLLIGCLGNHFI